jgi:hypothetical protein
MKEFYTAQIEHNQRVIEQFHPKFKNKHFHSGREIKPDDLVLFAFLHEEDNINVNRLTMTLISLHEDEVDNFHVIGKDPSGLFPYIKLKSE